jgi:CBS domain containing-hemolysin-like protein
VSADIVFALILVALAAVLSLFFSALTYSLRDFSRPKLTEQLQKLGMGDWLQRTIDQSGDLIFVTAMGRLFANLLVFIGILHALHIWGIQNDWARYGFGALIASFITMFVSVAIPHAVAEHAAEPLIAHSVRFLHALRIALLPLTRVLYGADRMVSRLARGGADEGQQQLEQQIEQEILSVVEEGEKEGVVDVQEREMITSVIEFGDSTVADAMTARPDIIGLPVSARLEQVKAVFEESGHSRLPVFEGTLDKIVGVLYARDLIKCLGEASDCFNTRTMMRPPFVVPETKPLRDLLNDFRAHKVHIAIVLDEYGGTAGLITIEDVLKELVGQVGDEHEPSEPSMIKRLDDKIVEADARIFIEQLNRLLRLNIPEDAGYETLGGFVSTTLGRIPEPGVNFEHNGVRYAIIDAEPQKVNRVKIEILAPKPEHAEPARSGA